MLCIWSTVPALAAYTRNPRPSLLPHTLMQQLQPRTPPPTMGTPVECEQQLDRGLLRACALGWAVVAAPMLLQPDVVTLDVFGLDVSGGYGVEQPAAGFLQLTGTEFALEAGLLLLLASDVLQPQQATRVGTAIVFAAAGLVGAYSAAASTGLTIVEPAAVAAVLGLSAASAASALRPLLREQSASELASSCALDARALVLGESDGEGSAAPASSTFYRLSALASVVVGGAFLFSPVSPLAVYEAELRRHLPVPRRLWRLPRLPPLARAVRPRPLRGGRRAARRRRAPPKPSHSRGHRAARLGGQQPGAGAGGAHCGQHEPARHLPLRGQHDRRLLYRAARRGVLCGAGPPRGRGWAAGGQARSGGEVALM